MSEETASVIDAARQLLAEFHERGSTPALWLFDPFTLEEIKAAAVGGHVQLMERPRTTFMGLPYKSSPRFSGLELLNHEAAVAAGHIAA